MSKTFISQMFSLGRGFRPNLSQHYLKTKSDQVQRVRRKVTASRARAAARWADRIEIAQKEGVSPKRVALLGHGKYAIRKPKYHK